MVSKDKPLLHMDDDEFEEAFDTVGRSIDSALMAEARRGCAGVSLAIAVLVRGTDERIVHYCPEYGGDEGISSVRDTIRTIRRDGRLEEGEELKLVVCRLDLKELLRHCQEFEIEE